MLWGKECSVHIGACFSGGSRLAPAGRAGSGREQQRFITNTGWLYAVYAKGPRAPASRMGVGGRLPVLS